MSLALLKCGLKKTVFPHGGVEINMFDEYTRWSFYVYKMRKYAVSVLGSILQVKMTQKSYVGSVKRKRHAKECKIWAESKRDAE